MGGSVVSIFISYVLLGLSLSAPIGPINAAQLDKGIKSGFMPAWLLGVGAMAADILYMILVYLGVVHFIETPFMKTFLWLFGFFVLMYTGIESLYSANRVAKDRTSGVESAASSLLSGFLLSMTNPLSILFWLGIYGSVLAETAATYHIRDLIIYSSAIILGVFLWDLFLACLASGFRKFLTTRILTFISILSGLSLIGFGLYFGLEAFRALFY